MKRLGLIRERLRNAHPDHHAIFRSMMWVSLFVLFGSLARAAKEVVIAYRYGVSADVDAYLFIFNLVIWPISVWFSVLTVVMVPLATRLRQDASAELPRFRSELFGLALVFGLALAFLLWVGLPLLLRSSWTGLPRTTVAIATTMVPTLALLAPLGVIISLFSAWMLAAGRHANTLLEGVPSVVILVALLAFPSGGVEPLVWGTLAGYAFHLASLATPLARQGELTAPRFTRESPQWAPFWQGFGIMLAGQTLMTFTVIVDQFFAARLDTGAIAKLSYAGRIMGLILGMGALAVTRATLPIFSKMQAHELRHTNRLALQWARVLFALGVIAMIVGWWLAPWGVRLLFEHGAFTPRDATVVTEVLRYGLTQLPFYFSGMVLVSLLASQRRYRAIAMVASSNLFVKVVANFSLVPLFGLNGLVLSTSCMYLISMILLRCHVTILLQEKLSLG